jgi:hypothetical protein
MGKLRILSASSYTYPSLRMLSRLRILSPSSYTYLSLRMLSRLRILSAPSLSDSLMRIPQILWQWRLDQYALENECGTIPVVTEAKITGTRWPEIKHWQQTCSTELNWVSLKLDSGINHWNWQQKLVCFT